MGEVNAKEAISKINADVEESVLKNITELHKAIFMNILKYAWSDFYFSEHEAQVADIVQKGFDISDDERSKMEVSVMKEVSKNAAKEKNYRGGVNIYSRWLEFEPDSKEAKKGLEICRKHLPKEKNKEEKPAVSPAKEEAPKEEKGAPAPAKEDVKKEEKVIEPPPPSQRGYPCPTCGKPLKWIEQYKRWYCYNCKKYV